MGDKKKKRVRNPLTGKKLPREQSDYVYACRQARSGARRDARSGNPAKRAAALVVLKTAPPNHPSRLRPGGEPMTVHFNITTPAGRAIMHVLEKSALADITHGIELREYDNGGRTLFVHPSFDSWASDGERSLMVAIESLAGDGFVNIAWLLDGLDDRCKRAICDAMFIASGFRGATVVSVP